jgi:hypothetical protein
MRRLADIAVEAVNTTVLHLRRIVGALCTALGRTRREVSDLAWDYRDLAGSARFWVRGSGLRTGGRTRSASTADGEHVADVISIELRRRKAN